MARGRWRAGIGCLVVGFVLLAGACGGESGVGDTADIAAGTNCVDGAYRKPVMPTAVQEMVCTTPHGGEVVIDRWEMDAWAKRALDRGDAWCALAPSMSTRSLWVVYHRNWSASSADDYGADLIHAHWASDRREVRCCGGVLCAPGSDSWPWWYWALAATSFGLVLVAMWRVASTSSLRRKRADAAKAYAEQERW